jgi:tetratricopeptide (TPR) repeat protein
MSSDLPTMGDMIDPDKNVQPVTENSTKKESPKKTQTDNTKEKGNSDKKTKKKGTNKKKEDKKEEEKKKEKKDEEKKEDKKVEDKKEEKKEEVKKEEVKKEEEKKEEDKKEEPKKEEEKKEEPKIEEEPKKEEKEPKKPREPEPKIPTDFTELIKEINDMKKSGNEKFKDKQIEEASKIYKEAYEKLEKELPKIDKERDYNPQSSDLFTLFIQLSQNLSLCYFKTEKYDDSINLDQKIIARDKNYDKAYFRLFKSYLKQGKKAQAVYFGNFLLGFDEETKKKYEEVIPEIEQTKKSLQEEYDAIRAQQRKEMMKSIAKYAIPIIVLIGAFAIYFFMFRKKRIAK